MQISQSIKIMFYYGDRTAYMKRIAILHSVGSNILTERNAIAAPVEKICIRINAKPS